MRSLPCWLLRINARSWHSPVLWRVLRGDSLSHGIDHVSRVPSRHLLAYRAGMALHQLLKGLLFGVLNTFGVCFMPSRHGRRRLQPRHTLCHVLSGLIHNFRGFWKL